MKEALLNLLEVNVNSPLTVPRILTTLVIALLLGLLILLVYKITYRGVLFNRSFGVALLMVALVTSVVIMPISSNIVLSLGMVGALSIVRFRTALKDPLDIVYMFWAIAVGLTTGAGFLHTGRHQLPDPGRDHGSGVGCPRPKASENPIWSSSAIRISFAATFRQILPKYSLKSKTATAKGFELVAEVSMRRQDGHFIEQLQRTEGIVSASLVRYSGDYN